MLLSKWLVPLLAGCLLAWAPAALADGRNYSQTYQDAAGQPFLEVTVSYLGKKPKGAFRRQHNWSQINTDFYKVTWKNLGDAPVEFRGMVTTTLPNFKPPKPKPYQPITRSGDLKRGPKKPAACAWPYTTLAVGAELVQMNKYLYSKVGPIVVTYTYKVRYKGRDYQVQERHAYRFKP